MDHARTEASPITRNAFVMAVADCAWPFPPPPARRAPTPELERAAHGVLAATARAWGLPERAPGGRQES